MRSRLFASTLMGVVMLSMAACGESDEAPASATAAPEPQPETFVVRGEILITNNSVGADEGEDCTPNDTNVKYLTPGGPIVVTDASGTDVGLTRLGDGVAEVGPSTLEDPEYPIHDCRIEFEVSDVPSGSAVYSLTLGGGNEIQFTEDEAAEISLSVDGGETPVGYDDEYDY